MFEMDREEDKSFIFSRFVSATAAMVTIAITSAMITRIAIASPTIKPTLASLVEICPSVTISLSEGTPDTTPVVDTA